MISTTRSLAPCPDLQAHGAACLLDNPDTITQAGARRGIPREYAAAGKLIQRIGESAYQKPSARLRGEHRVERAGRAHGASAAASPDDYEHGAGTSLAEKTKAGSRLN